MAKCRKGNSDSAAKNQSTRCTFIREYSYAGLLPTVKQQICDMDINGSGIQETIRVLGFSQAMVIKTLKKVQS